MKRELKIGKEEHCVKKKTIVKHRADFSTTAKSPGHKLSICLGLARDFIIGANYRKVLCFKTFSKVLQVLA